MSGDGPSPKTFRVKSTPVHVPTRVGIPMALALALLLAGPRPRVDESIVPIEVPADVSAWVAEREASVAGLRPGDGKEVVWADPEARRPTGLALVYLHGFSADRHEIDPVPQRVADALGANLFLTRLAGHGREAGAMREVEVADWLRDVQEAIAVGKRLGDRVVLLGTSTGATLALWAAAQEELAGDVAGLVLLSPNLHPRDRNSRILLLPWGRVVARLAIGPLRCFEPLNPEQRRHWTTCYPTGALAPMMALVERVRTMELSEIRAPTLVLYSPEDQVVDPAETERAFAELGSPSKRIIALTDSEDPADHVLAGDIVSPSTNDRVVELVVDFLRSSGVAPAGAEEPPAGAGEARADTSGSALRGREGGDG